MTKMDVTGLCYRYPGNADATITDVSLSLPSGGIVGLTGRSGSGKSTLARLLCGHLRPDAGSITINGKTEHAKGFNPVQLLAQTPIFAVNPRWKIERIICEAWEPDDAVRNMFGVRLEWYNRFAHELSGGELQRVAILRSLAPGVRYLVADEISTMLDPITQAEIWTSLRRIGRERQLGILAIGHDRPLLARISDRIIEIE